MRRLAFTEVAFEAADSGHPLCRLSRERNLRAVYRILDMGEPSGRHRAHLTIHAPEEAALEVVRELRAARVGQVDVLHQGGLATSALIEAPARPEGGAVGMAALPALLAQHGLGGILDPLVASGGRLRGRIILPRRMESQEAIRAMQAVQRASGFPELRVLRTAPVEPAAHVELARRVLSPEQEEILALAASMGYYETPKLVTLEEIAARVGLSISPVHKRLKAAEEALVALHIEARAPPVPRRRARVAPAVDASSAPWEVVVRARRPGVGPADLVERTPGSLALLHAMGADRERGGAWILVLLAGAEEQAKLASALVDRDDVEEVKPMSQDAAHAAFRVHAAARGAFHLPWWGEVWGNDAHLRSIALEENEGVLRVLLLRPHTQERLQARLLETSRLAGWDAFEIIAARPLGASTPPEAPDALTSRQMEVLRVAHALGYYRTPRGCTLESVASTLGVSANAVHKNLVLAEAKLISAYLAIGL